MTHLSVSLCPEMLMEIFSYFDSPQELISCCRVSKAWRSVALDNILWQPFYPTLDSSELSIPFNVNLWKVESESEVINLIHRLARRTNELSSCKFEFFTLNSPSTISVKIGPVEKMQAFSPMRKVEIVWTYALSNSDKKIVPAFYCPYLLKEGTTISWIDFDDDNKRTLVKELRSLDRKKSDYVSTRAFGIALLVMSSYLAYDWLS